MHHVHDRIATAQKHDGNAHPQDDRYQGHEVLLQVEDRREQRAGRSRAARAEILRIQAVSGKGGLDAK
jgi:hypothetical protein